MNIVEFWEKQISKWNEEEKCGFCWSFHAPMTESAANLQRTNDCCVQVLLTQDKVNPFVTSNTYDAATGLLERVTCTRNFQLLFLLPSNVGTNNYSEMPEHSVDESKWAKILYKLQDCLSCDLHLDFCEMLGREYQITQWTAKQEINIFDDIYSGYRLTVSLTTVV